MQLMNSRPLAKRPYAVSQPLHERSKLLICVGAAQDENMRHFHQVIPVQLRGKKLKTDWERESKKVERKKTRVIR